MAIYFDSVAFEALMFHSCCIVWKPKYVPSPLLFYSATFSVFTLTVALHWINIIWFLSCDFVFGNFGHLLPIKNRENGCRGSLNHTNSFDLRLKCTNYKTDSKEHEVRCIRNLTSGLHCLVLAHTEQQPANQKRQFFWVRLAAKSFCT